MNANAVNMNIVNNNVVNPNNVSGGGNVNAVVDPSVNPFYLHPGENPGSVLVTPLSDGRNYHDWSKDMLMALKTKNKVGFVN